MTGNAAASRLNRILRPMKYQTASAIATIGKLKAIATLIPCERSTGHDGADWECQMPSKVRTMVMTPIAIPPSTASR